MPRRFFPGGSPSTAMRGTTLPVVRMPKEPGQDSFSDSLSMWEGAILRIIETPYWDLLRRVG